MKQLKVFLVTGLLLLIGEVARASITEFTDRSDFNLQGVIAYNSNFQDYPGIQKYSIGFSSPGDPFSRGDVTYTSSENLVWGPDGIGASGHYTTTEPLIGNNAYTPIQGVIATTPKYTMFGFDIGTFGSSPISITVYTNQNSYTYPGLTIANSVEGKLDFKGYSTSSGEYFTGFKIVADNGSGNLPGMTNVAVGNLAAPAPEPDTLFLMGIGACLVLFCSKHRRVGVGAN